MSNTINLLSPSTSIRTRIKSEAPSKLLISGCVFMILVTLAVYSGFFALNWKLDREMVKVKDQIVNIAAATRQELAVDKVKAELQQTNALVKVLQAKKPKLSLYLEEMETIIPSAVYLTNLEISHDPFELNIKGSASSQTEVAQFGKNLQDSEIFGDSIIGSSEKRVTDTFYTFIVTVTPQETGGKRR